MATRLEESDQELMEQLKPKLMTAIQCGYIEPLNHVKKKIPKFYFNFVHTVEVEDETNGQLKKKLTPLLYACKCNQTDVVEWLLQQPKVNKNDRTELKETPLIVAVSNEEVDMEMIKELLKHGDQNLGEKNKHKLTALHIACVRGNIELVQLLLQYNTAWAAKGNTAPKIIGTKELKNKWGNTPFMMAIMARSDEHKEIVHTWLDMEKEPSMILRPICEDVNKKGYNAVMIAAHTGQLECLKKMEECKSITDDLLTMKAANGWNIIHCAAASGSLETLEWLLSFKDSLLKTTEILDAPNKKGYTPFLCACEYHHYEIVEFFITLDDIVDINAKTIEGMTGIHLAAHHNDVRIVDLLLKHGVDCLIREEKEGNTVLHIATSKAIVKVENRLKQEKDFDSLVAITNYANKTAEDIRQKLYVPLEIKKRGQKSIDAYLDALSKGKTKNTHCNLIVLGEGRVGKTSLIKSILSMEFDPDCKPTQGVILEEIGLAENIDITVSPESDIWKTVKPLTRVADQYVDCVAHLVSADVSPKTPVIRKYFEDIPQDELLTDIKKIVNRIRPKEPKPRSTSYKHERSTQERPPYSKPITEDIDSLFDIKLKKIPNHPHPSLKDEIKHKEIVNRPIEPDAVEVPETTSQPTQPPNSSDNSSPPQHRHSSLPHELSKQIGKRFKKSPKKLDNLTLHTIDFAGQVLYRPMHHCFITNRAVYIIVFKLTEVRKYLKSPESSKAQNPICEIRYWLNNVIAHGSNPATDDTDKEEFPRIFLVGTHLNGDKEDGPLSPDELETINDHLSETFLKDPKESRYEISIMYHKDCDKIVFAIENSLLQKECGVVPLMKDIRELRNVIPFLSKDVPTSYMKFEKKLLEMKESRKGHPLATTRQEVEEWAQECDIIEKDEIDTVIQFFHDIRVIVDQTLISNPFQRLLKSTEDPSATDETPTSVLLSTETPASVLLSTETPASVLSTETPASVLSTETPASVLSTETPASVLSTETPASVLSTETPASVLSTETPASVLSTETPASVLSTETPASVLSTETPASVLSTETPASVLSTETPASVLLSPQWLGNVMSAIVEMNLKDKSIIPALKIKNFDNYGILHCNDLIKYVHAKLGSDLIRDDERWSNVLEILQSYCLIYKLSPLHCKLLGLKPDDVASGNYLIPIKLPSEIKEGMKGKVCSTFDVCYKIEFDFQSYLPEEVYVQTVCYFLEMITKWTGKGFKSDHVFLSRNCSVFNYIKLEHLPKAHWMIEMNNVTNTLKFSIRRTPQEVEGPYDPSSFIIAIAKHILDRVCKNGCLGYLKYNGGPRTVCSSCKTEVLLPFINSDGDVEKSIDCPHCKVNPIDVNDVLSEMVKPTPDSGNDTVMNDRVTTDGDNEPTVIAKDFTEIEKCLKKHYSNLIELIGGSLIKLANDLWSEDLMKDEDHNYVLTALGVSSYVKSSYLMMKFYESLSSVKNVTAQKEMFNKFCDVLVGQKYPSLETIANQIKDELHTL